jgi:hypothetical protein
LRLDLLSGVVLAQVCLLCRVPQGKLRQFLVSDLVMTTPPWSVVSWRRIKFKMFYLKDSR